MLYVLLVLLKIIGILLALAVGLIILVLAAPIRYSFRFRMDEDTPPGGHIRVTWLFCIFYLKASYIDKMFDYRVRIFGYQIMGSQKEFLEKKRKKKERKQKKKKRQKEKKKPKKGSEAESLPEIKTEPVGEVLTQEPRATDVQKMETAGKKADVREADAPAKNAVMKGTEEKKTDAKHKSIGKKQKTSVKPKKNRRKGRIAFLKKKIETLKALWKEYNGKQLLDFAKTTIIKILKHVLPRKLRGYIRFGFDDPAVTGMVTGAAALFYPKYQKNFSLEPNFQSQCFAADCLGRGRIHFGFFLYIGITALMNRDVRNLIKKMF